MVIMAFNDNNVIILIFRGICKEKPMLIHATLTTKISSLINPTLIIVLSTITDTKSSHKSTS